MSASPQPQRRPARRLLLAGFVLALGVLTAWELYGLARPAPITAVGAGTLTIDDDVYPFTPTTCFITDQDFVAAGTGSSGSDQFWVSASSSGLNLTFGTENEIDHPPSDKLWLVSDDTIDWFATGRKVTAQTEMSDHRIPGFTPVTGHLELRCDI
jgi:hypothetical protein